MMPRFAASLPFVSVVAMTLFGCSARHDATSSKSTGSASQPIIGGAVDDTDTWVVGIDIGGSELCSGTLIAPNLVLTARHCVSQTPESLDCTASNNIIGNFPASTFQVSTAQFYGSSPRYGVRNVYYLNDATCSGGSVTKECTVCGFDLALLELSSNVPTPYKSPSLTKAHTGTYDAIGYGCQDVPSGGSCSSSGYRMKITDATVIDITGPDITINGRVCGGDSGSPLYDPTNDWIMGALSRGDGPGGTGPSDPGCTVGIYTRTDLYAAWLQKYGAKAATDGGYTPPAWVTYTPPVTDAGSHGGSLGDPCTAPGDCASNVCISVDGKQVCSQACSGPTKCPSGYTCTSGYCIAAPPVVDSGAPPPPDDASTPTDSGTPIDVDTGVNPDQPDALSDTKGGCAIGGRGAPPPRPQPWIFGLFAASAWVVARRRRR